MVSSKEVSISFDNELIQGALVTGVTKAQALRFDGKQVTLDDQGRFVFGLGRDAAPTLKLELTDPLGRIKTLHYQVRQRDYLVQEITGVAQKYVSPPASVLARIKSESLLVSKARQFNRIDAADFFARAIWPAKGPITGVYGSQRVFNGVPKRPHYGLDIAGPVGSPVVAPFAGRVTLAEPDLYYSGGTLIIDHGRGVSSTFIHLSALHVELGDDIEQGQRIADIGATGRVTGPHLDWRMNWFSTRLDPHLLLTDPSDKAAQD